MLNVLRTMWLFQGYSIRKIAAEFNNTKEYVDKWGEVSVSSVSQYVRAFRRDAEKWVDEDALEKYTAEFVRKQHTIDEEIDKLLNVQKLLDTSDPKNAELYLKFETAIHSMHMNQIKMMSEIELVITIKKFNKERRLKNETLIKLPNKDEVKAQRGYLSVDSDVSIKNDEDRESHLRKMREDETEEHDNSFGKLDRGN